MNETDPVSMKHIGDNVANFDEDVWMTRARDVMMEANMAKFNQSAVCRQYLLDSGTKHLAEASPTDTYWGIGLGLRDANILKRDTWPIDGHNAMGHILMQIRDHLKQQ